MKRIKQNGWRIRQPKFFIFLILILLILTPSVLSFSICDIFPFWFGCGEPPSSSVSFGVIKDNPHWKLIDSTGNFETYIADSTDKKTHLGWYVKQGVNISSVNLSDRVLYDCNNNIILDDKNKPITLKYETNKVPCTIEPDQMCNGYFIRLTDASAVNINDCVKLNPYVVYQNDSTIAYQEEGINLSCQVFMNNSIDYILYPDTINLFTPDENETAYRFSFNLLELEDNSTKDFKLVCNSTYPIKQSSGEFILKSRIADIPETYFITEIEEKRFIPEEVCSDGCEIDYGNYYNEETFERAYFTYTFSKIPIYNNDTGFYDIDVDPSLDYVYTSTSNLISWQNNRTEASHLGVRLDAPVLFMDFNKPNEGTYIQDNSIYNNFGIIPTGGAEYLANKDMELSAVWTNVGSPVTLAHSSEQKHSGSYSYKVIANTTNGGIAQRPLTLPLSTTFQYSGWMYHSAKTVRLGIQYTPSYTYFTSCTQSTTYNKWIYDSCLMTTTSGEVTYSFAAQTQDTSNIFYVDDVSLSNNRTPRYNGTGGYDGSGAYSFDGYDRFTVADNSQLRFDSGEQDFTLSAWVKREFVDKLDYIIDKRDASNDGYSLYITSGNTIVGKVDSLSITSSTNALADTNWHHIVLTIDRDGNGQIYLDGLANGSTTSINKEVMATTASVSIGGASYTIPGGMNGHIDQVQIWDRALSADEVLNLYNGTINNSEYIGKYSRDGDFKSLVFYNSTSSYWNVTLSIADTYSTRTGIVNNKNEINLSNPNLVGYWDLDGNANDATGKNNGTLVNGVNNATGLSSGAMYFDGVNDYISIPDSNSLDLTSEITLSSWTYIRKINANQVILDKYFDGSNRAYLLMIGNNNKIDFRVSITGGDPIALYSNTTLSINQWYHISATKNASGWESIYINGVLDNSQNVNSPGIKTNADSLDIGALRYAPGSPLAGFYLNGSIDEVLIYNKSLSASEITQLYKSGLSQHADTNITLQTRTATSYNVSDSTLSLMLSFDLYNTTHYLDSSQYGNNFTKRTVISPLVNGTVGMSNFNSPINITQTPSLDMATGSDIPFSVSLWAKCDSYNSLELLQDFDVNDVNYDWALDTLTANNNLTLLLYSSSSAGIYATSSGLSPYIDRWTHIVAVYDGSATKYGINLFFNGENKTNSYASFGSYTTLRDFSNLIQGLTTSGENCLFDELRVYKNKRLYPNEIQDIYNLGSYHINWIGGEDNWTNRGLIKDLNQTQPDANASFIQFRYDYATNNTDVSPYILNHSIHPNDKQQIYIPPSDSSSPAFTESPKNDTFVYLRDFLVKQINATDETGIDQFFINDTARFNISFTGNFTNTTTLAIGIYYVNISVNDTLGYINSSYYQATIVECDDNTDCQTCYKCSAGSCVVQTSAEDLKDECPLVGETCNTGFCSGVDNTCGIYQSGEEGTCPSCSACTDADSDCDFAYENNPDQIGVNVCENCSICTAGSCYNTEDTTDLSGFCNGLECDGDASTPYYHGWDTLECYYRLDETAEDHICSAGSCETESVACVDNNQDGSSGVNCNCEAAEIGCSSTTIGSCNNDLCDTRYPSFNETYANQTLEYYYDALFIDINASDDSGIDQFWINDTSRFNISFKGILKNITTTPVGVYYINISVNDTYGKVNSTILNINVSDTIAPRLDLRVNNSNDYSQVLELGVDFLCIYANSTDESDIDIYNSFLNVSRPDDILDLELMGVDDFNNSCSQIFYMNGTYNVTFQVTDIWGNINITWSEFEVVDTLSPTFDEIPQNDTLQYLTSLIKKINATDYNYTKFFINDTGRFNITWDGTLTNFTILGVGTYYLNISVNDTSFNINSSYYQLDITPFTPTLDISVTPTTEHIYGTLTAASVSGCIENLVCYLYLNGTEVTPPDYKVLNVSHYNYTYLTDGNTNFTSSRDEQIVIVSGAENVPSMIETINGVYQYGVVNSTWVRNDMENYSVYEDNINPGLEIHINFTNFTAFNQIMFNVLYVASPAQEINIFLFNTSYEWTSIGIIPDNTPGYILRKYSVEDYSIYIVEDKVQMILAKNTTGNTNYVLYLDYIYLNATDIKPPTFDEIPQNDTVYYLENIYKDINATDDTSSVYWSINDTARFNISQEGVLINYTTLGIGNYSLNISINDTFDNINHSYYSVEILQSLGVCSLDFDLPSPITYGTSFTVSSTCTSSYSIYRNNGFLTSSSALQNLDAGTYEYEVNRTDTENYSVIYEQQYYTVNKATATLMLWLNGSESSHNQAEGWVNISAMMNSPASGSLEYKVNSTLAHTYSDKFENISYWTKGHYNITVEYQGALNYKEARKEYLLTITSLADTSAPTFDEIPQNDTLEYWIGMSKKVNATDYSELAFSINDTDRFNITYDGQLINKTTLGTGIYYLNISVNDTNKLQNHTMYSLTITATSSLLILLLNGTDADKTSLNWSNATAYFTKGYGDISLYRNDTLLNTGYNWATNESNHTLESVYNYTAIFDGNENFSLSRASHLLTIAAEGQGYFIVNVSDRGIEWVEFNWSQEGNVNIEYSEDNLTWLHVVYVNTSTKSGWQYNLQEDTTYYYRAKNTTSNWYYFNDVTKIGGVLGKMEFTRLVVFGLFFVLSLVLIAFMHKFKEDNSSVAYGFFSGVLLVLLGALGMFGFQIITLDSSVSLPFNINSMIATLCFALALYSFWFSTTLWKQKHEIIEDEFGLN